MKGNSQAIAIVYLSGFLQGVCLIFYPSAGPIFTNPDFHGLSSGQFGVLFTPQIILAIMASFSAPALAKRWRMKKVLQIGLLANLISMGFLAGSHFFIEFSSYWPFVMLLLGTASLGAGFGLTITAVNPYAYSFFPGKETSAVTALHILLGLGTAISAIILNYFSSLGTWWGAPLLTGAILTAVVVWMFSLPMPLTLPEPSSDREGNRGVPNRVWAFFAVVFLYGACEATFGNWAPIYLEQEAGLSLSGASLGLSLFWGAIALGRLLFTLAALRFNLWWLHIFMPVLVAAVFFAMPELSGVSANYTALVLAGLGLSFYFPFSISLATEEFPAYSATVSGMLVAAIQLGTGVSSNVIGMLNGPLSLGSIIRFSAFYALLMFALAGFIYITRKNAAGAIPTN